MSQPPQEPHRWGAPADESPDRPPAGPPARDTTETRVDLDRGAPSHGWVADAYAPPRRDDAYRADPYRADPHRAAPYRDDPYRAEPSRSGQQHGSGQSYQEYPSYPPVQDRGVAAGSAGWATGAAQGTYATGAPWADPAPRTDTVGRPVRRPRRERAGLVVVTVLLALLAGALGGVGGSVLADRTGLAGAAGPGRGDSGTSGTDTGDATGSGFGAGAAEPLADPAAVSEVAARVLPSVVSIRVANGSGEGTGSGFVIDAEGLILTNNHVIAAGGDQPADDIVVELADGSQAEAEVVGAEASYDVAVIRIDPADAGRELVALPFGDSDGVLVGEQVVAVGAPLGLDATVTTGIVSALNRPVSAGGGTQQTAFINAIQTDAAINPGNSGGPLVNLRGEVVGVNSAIAQAPGGPQGGSIGLGFSIPSNQAARTAQQLVEDGVATYPVVGVLLDRLYQGEGVRIVTESDDPDQPPVTPGGPADLAGLEAGDVILAFEGRPVTESDELVVAIRAQQPGDDVTLTVRRDEDVFDVTVTLEEGEQG
ncbi:S1C family serine protease [Aquipuribacter sp. SD81]|uniref:S1C family serine protease n=1 Tax=Aquipuribacter sp. SD81 TaxID=3127703 RepID=UPI00301B4948